MKTEFFQGGGQESAEIQLIIIFQVKNPWRIENLTQTTPRTQPLPRQTCLLRPRLPLLQFLPVRNNRRNSRGLCLLRVRRLSRGSRSGFRGNRIYSLCRNASLRRRIRMLMSGLLKLELLIYHIFYT